MNPLRLSTYTVSSALGAGRAAHAEALRAGTTGLARIAFDTNTLDCWLGEVRDFDVPITGTLAAFDCRNNRLAEFAQRYAQRLEVYVRGAPYNWFNFYDYWQPGVPTDRESAAH